MDPEPTTRTRSLKRKSAEQPMELDQPSASTATVEAAAGSNDELPSFPALKKANMGTTDETRRVLVPSNRLSPLKTNWLKLFTPVVEHLKLQMRFNMKKRLIEIRTCEATEDISSLQKAEDFVRAFLIGFNIDDALALMRLDELFLESFQVEDVKPLKGDHLSRAIGRLAGKNGRTKFSIENATRTRIVLADNKIHILGSYANIRAARTAICSLILGSPPSKIYGNLRHISARLSERF